MTQAGLSFTHHRIKRLRGLVRKPSLRRAEGVVVVEGVELLATALAAGARVESVYVAPECPHGLAPVELALARGARVFDLGPGVIERVATTVHPQPVVSIVGFAAASTAAVPPATDNALIVVCAEVRDPGNAGTVIRTADAVGAAAVVFADATVDPSNPKTVRASAGSIFHLPVICGGAVLDVIGRLREDGYVTVGSLARGGVPYTDFDWRRAVAIVLGNEAAGLSDETAEALDATVTIPLDGRAESLNVSTAAAVICFEARRQRTEGAGGPASTPLGAPAATATGGRRPTMPGMETTAAATAKKAGPADG